MSTVAEALSSAKIIARDVVPLVYKMAVKPPKPETIDNLPLRLANTASQSPNKIAIVFEGRSITWGELDKRVSQVAQALRDRGVGFGDTVSMMMDNRIEFIENMLVRSSGLFAVFFVISHSIAKVISNHLVSFTWLSFIF